MEQFVAELNLYTVAFLLVAGFIACFIDSTVGGGGLISTPALLALGLPVPLALGTNKLSASTGAFTSILSFWRAGKINKVALYFM
ncbi:MAG: TSUP family transporter, partial [Phascolarctobacterium sp.]|nr:TSUP family transporter [Phascolarctobacterium sp.]